MNITITSPGLPLFLLGDDTISQITITSWPAGIGGAIKEGFLNKQKRQVQTASLVRSAYALGIPRFNAQNKFAFTVQRTFSTIPLCIKFIGTHPDTVPASGEIAISEKGVAILFSPNAIVESIECVKVVGCSCDFQYGILCNGPWQTTS